MHRSRNILGLNDAITEAPHQNNLNSTIQSPQNVSNHTANCTKPAVSVQTLLLSASRESFD